MSENVRYWNAKSYVNSIESHVNDYYTFISAIDLIEEDEDGEGDSTTMTTSNNQTNNIAAPVVGNDLKIYAPDFDSLIQGRSGKSREEFQVQMASWVDNNSSKMLSIPTKENGGIFTFSHPEQNKFHPGMAMALGALAANLKKAYPGQIFNSNSGYRSRAYNAGIDGAATNSAHMGGIAIDITATSEQRDAIRNFAIKIGFGGKIKYPNKGFIHIDMSGPLDKVDNRS